MKITKKQKDYALYAIGIIIGIGYLLASLMSIFNIK